MSIHLSKRHHNESVLDGIVANGPVNRVFGGLAAADMISPNDDIGIPRLDMRVEVIRFPLFRQFLPAQEEHQERPRRELGWIFDFILEQKERSPRKEFALATVSLHRNLASFALHI